MRIRMRPWSLAAGLLFAWGCSGSKAEVRGKAPVGTTITVAALARQPANGAVTLRGTMVEK